MVTIMCAQRLWRTARLWSPTSPSSTVEDRRLIGWAATVSVEDGQELVLALEVQTYLTVVFPLGPESSFRAGFTRALAEALEDCGVADDAIALEVQAARSVTFSRLKDGAVREALNRAKEICSIELSYHSDLRVVQRNLNEFPHPLPPDYVPRIALKRLFKAVPGVRPI